MELKYVCRDLPGGTRTRSNRTFMELKSEYPFKQWL